MSYSRLFNALAIQSVLDLPPIAAILVVIFKGPYPSFRFVGIAGLQRYFVRTDPLRDSGNVQRTYFSAASRHK